LYFVAVTLMVMQRVEFSWNTDSHQGTMRWSHNSCDKFLVEAARTVDRTKK